MLSPVSDNWGNTLQTGKMKQMGGGMKAYGYEKTIECFVLKANEKLKE